MKLHMVILCGIITFLSCSKDSDSDTKMNCTKNQAVIDTDNGTKLNLNKQEWYLKKNEIGGGSTNLKISGSIVGDSATIRTFGDGIISDEEININSNNEFNEDVMISFTATSIPEADIIANTLITVYGISDTLKVDLESCLLRY